MPLTPSDIYKNIYTEDEVFRPIYEHRSLLLEVARGCSWAGCRFCDFPKDGFCIYPLEEIRSKLSWVTAIAGDNRRIFFMGCNALCLPTEDLLTIMDWVHLYLPLVDQISMYARADDVLRKGAGDMYRLVCAGLTDLHIGLESGSDAVLAFHNKGETVAQMKAAMDILDGFGICYHLTMIPGLGGRQLSREHAEQTAAFLNSVHPTSIWNTGLYVFPGTPLEDMVRRGEFIPLTRREMLIEERALMSLLQLQSTCLYVDTTVLAKYTIKGLLPEGKDSLLEVMDRLLAEDED